MKMYPQQFNVYSRNLGSAALDPEPIINRLPERSGEARNLERDKASLQHPIRPVSLEQSAKSQASRLCQTIPGVPIKTQHF